MDAKDKQQEVERWLDAALVPYSKAEPRDGLEGRVLANLRQEKDRLATRRRWWWTAGSVAAMAVVAAAVWAGVSETRRAPNLASGPFTTDSEDATTSRQKAPSPPVIEPTQTVVRSPRRRVTSAAVTHAREPKLDQFPSPVPLTDQERMLAQYVQEFPQRAVLVARAQTQLRKQEEREMGLPAPGSGSSRNSEQPE